MEIIELGCLGREQNTAALAEIEADSISTLCADGKLHPTPSRTFSSCINSIECIIAMKIIITILLAQ